MQPPYYNCCRWYHFLDRWKKILFLPRCYNDEIISNIKTHFHTDKKLLELFCIENDFAKYFAKFLNLSICFAHYSNLLK